MAAYEIPNLRFSGVAGGTIENRRFVVVDADERMLQASDNTTDVVGASVVPVVEDEVAEVYDGIVMVEAAEAISAGTSVMSDADGRAVAFTAGAEGGAVVKVGTAITNAGAAGELLSVKI